MGLDPVRSTCGRVLQKDRQPVEIETRGRFGVPWFRHTRSGASKSRSVTNSVHHSDATAMVVARLRIQLARSIAWELLLQPRLRLRSDANRWSKVSPICNRPAARVKAPKQDAKPGVLQDSPTADDRHWLPKNIGGRNSSDPALRHRYRSNSCCRNRESSRRNFRRSICRL